VIIDDSFGSEFVVIGSTVIVTPYGQGQVVDCDYETKIFKLKLSSFFLFSHAASVLHWLRAAKQQNKIEYINRLVSEFHNQIYVTIKDVRESFVHLEKNDFSMDGTDFDDQSQENVDDQPEKTLSNISSDKMGIEKVNNRGANSSNLEARQLVGEGFLKKLLKSKYCGGDLNSSVRQLFPLMVMPLDDRELLKRTNGLLQNFSEFLLWDSKSIRKDKVIEEEVGSGVDNSTHTSLDPVFIPNQSDKLGYLTADSSRLKELKCELIHKINSARSEATMFSTATTNIRLKMFTRRISYRTLLAMNNINPSTILPINSVNSGANLNNHTLVLSALARAAENLHSQQVHHGNTRGSRKARSNSVTEGNYFS
jgi:hypothetical protein